MKHFLTLILRYIIGQKGRSLLAVAGLVTAVALISAAGILGANISAGYVEQARKTSGSWHANFDMLEEREATVIAAHTRVNRAGIIRDLGIARPAENGMEIIGAAYDDTALELANMALLEGKLPRQSHEIALEEWALKEIGLEARPGREITLSFSSSSGNETGETVYTICGILANQTLSQITGYAQAVVGGGTGETYRVLAEFRKQYDPREAGESIAAVLGLEQNRVTYNESLLQALADSGQEVLHLILGLIILAATVAAIHNIFHIAVLERIRQYGLLRAIGTGPKQIRRIVLGEGLLLALVAIPVGLLAGIAGTRVMVSLASTLTGSFTRMVIPWWTLAWAGAICIAAVLISAWRPARLAARVSPMEALRGTASVLPESKVPRPGRQLLPQNIFGINGMLAWRNLQRYRRQFNITVFSLSLCVVLAIVFSYYAGAARPELILQGQFPGEFVLSTRSFNQNAGFSAEDLEAVRRLGGVSEVFSTRESGANLLLPADKVTAEFSDLMENTFGQTFPQSGTYSSSTGLYGYSENILELARSYLETGVIDPGRLAEGGEVLVVNNTRGGGKILPVTTLAVGDEITLCTAAYDGNRIVFGEEQTFTVAGFLNNHPFPQEMITIGLAVVMHEDAFTAFTGSDLCRRIDVRVLEEADVDQIDAALRTIAGRVSQGRVISYRQQIREMEEQKRQLSILIFSLLGMVMLISLFSITNTISTNLLLRTREFGILRALGATRKQLVAILRMEGLLYGLVSVAWGAVAGNLLAWGTYLFARSEAAWLTWSPPWQSTLLICAVAILITLLATVAPLRRITRMNVIDVIRQVY